MIGGRGSEGKKRERRARIRVSTRPGERHKDATRKMIKRLAQERTHLGGARPAHLALDALFFSRASVIIYPRAASLAEKNPRDTHTHKMHSHVKTKGLERRAPYTRALSSFFDLAGRCGGGGGGGGDRVQSRASARGK